MTNEEAIKYLQDVKYPKVNYDDVLALQRCMIVEPKFKVGDWIVYKNDICQIVKREEGCNKLVTVFGIIKELVNERNLSTARLWTIQDAKDGDVLADNNATIIFRKIGNNTWNDVVDYYVGYSHSLDKINIQSGVSHYGKINKVTFKPATKEQRILLFSKIGEAGYYWDAEKKELKKIEQKPADKVELKFKSGNWYLCVKDFFGKGVRFDKGNAYYCKLDGCLQEFDSGAHIDIVEELYEYFRLWTIQDAKDGDVLCSYPEYEYPWIGIFHRLNIDKYSFTSHCYLQAGLHGKFCPPSGVNIFGERNVDKHSLNVVPATKEQRDLLLSKMKEAGYEWDDKKKELKEIEQKPKEKYEWSEEDENMIEDIIEAIDTQYAVSDYNDMVSWLKSLKERMKGDKQ